MPKEKQQEEQKQEARLVLEDGKEILFSDLDKKQSLLVGHVRDIDGKLMNLNFQAQQLQAAKNSFSAELNASFKEDKKDDKDA
jgi:seryl-tRNA synthetase